MKTTQIEDLITIDDKLQVYLTHLDFQNTKDRQLAIEVMEVYIRRYITPAMHLPHTDIDGVVGKQITGLGLSFLFDSRRKDLSRPSDEELDEVFDELVEQKATPQSRNDFWTAWLVREACSCIGTLCNFLDEPLSPTKEKQITPSILRQEIEQLQQILKLPMTAIKSRIEILIESEQEALKEWTNDPKYFITIES